MVANVFGEEWDFEQEQPGFRWKRMRLGVQLGAEKIGASVYELPPGERSFPYHLHHANEEMLIVLEGEVVVRGEDGEEACGRGDAVLFRAGRAGAHQIRNRSSRPARFVVVSTLLAPEVVEYPDSGKIAAMAGSPPGRSELASLKLILRRDAEAGYFEDEPVD